ncbi:hypothetical protein KBB08_00665 [Candidatus Gracilibacteria bacterium]|nr:hypothetical protein [Candidatus Gracilibacteria bacterium]
MTTNQNIATIFQNLAYALAIEDEKVNHFRIVAYENAARILRSLPEDLTTMAKDNELPKIPGIGKAMIEKILNFIATGQIPAYEEILKTFPESFFAILRIPHIGPKTAKLLFNEYQVRSLADLDALLQTDKLEHHEGFGEKSLANLREGFLRLKKDSNRKPIASVLARVEEIISYIRQCPALDQIAVAGSVRRIEETIGDVDILATAEDAEAVIKHFTLYPNNKLVQAEGETKASLILEDDLQVDLRVVPQHSFGAALQYFTGSKEHNVALRNIAKEQGLKLNEYGIFRGEDNIASQTEQAVYEAVGIHYVPPELRRNNGEIEEAKEHDFTWLVEITDIDQNHAAKLPHIVIEPQHWEDYITLKKLSDEAKKTNSTLELNITNQIPPLNTWLFFGRETTPLYISPIPSSWQKTLLIGYMRRARIHKTQLSK